MSPQPGATAAAGRALHEVTIDSHETQRLIFGRCTACAWTSQEQSTAVESSLGHVVNRGHEVLLIEHTVRIVSPASPKGGDE